MDFIKKLIDDTLKYIKEAKIKSYNDISLSMRATEIILNERKFDISYKGPKKCDIFKCDKLVREFLSVLNPQYLEYYETRLLDGTIEFDLENKDIQPFSAYDYENNKREIYIPITNTIEDAFTIIHELFHDMNLVITEDDVICTYEELEEDTEYSDNELEENDEEEQKLGRYYFTEGLSYLGELMFSDFLKQHGKGDMEVDNRNLCSMREQALILNFKLNLINEYLINGYLDKQMVVDIFNAYDSNNIEKIISNIYKKQDEFDIESEETYVFSSLIAVYMYDRIKTNKKYVNELFDLNEILDNLHLNQVLDYLELDHNKFELTNEAYDLLQKKYRKFIKRQL